MKNSKPHANEDGGAHRVSSFLFSAIGGLSLLAARIGAVLLIVMLAVIGYSVVQRYFFNTPLTWTDELTGYLVVAIVMFGAAETLRRDEHIAIDLLTATRRGVVKKIIGIWGNLAIIAVALTLLAGARSTLDYSYNFDIVSNGYLEVPMWIPESSMVVGGVLLLLVAIVRIVRQISGK